VDTGKLMIHVFGDDASRQKVGLEEHLDALAKRKKEIEAMTSGDDESFENNRDK